MRLLQVTIPTGKRETIERALDDEGVDYVLTDETSGRKYTAVAYVPLPTAAVEPVLERLREAGLDEQAYTVIVDANTVISRRFDELQERYAEEEDEERIAREELTSKAWELAPITRNYVILTVVSAVIATAGLLLDSPAIIVGSMVIAPLIGPAMAASVGTVVNDQKLFRQGLILQFGGLMLAIASAAIFAWSARSANLIPPGLAVADIPSIRERLLPDFLSLVVAIGAGIAGVISLSAGVSTALVGVMIAVALIPPAATVGIGMAWGDPWVSLPAAVLTLVNILSINLAALAVLWIRGYRPSEWFDEDQARQMTRRRIAALVVAIAVLSVFLGGITLDSFERSTTEQALRADASAVLDSRPEAMLLDVEIERTEGAIFREPNGVVVTVGLPPGGTAPSLVSTLDQRFEQTAERNIETQIRYVTVEGA